MEVSSFTPSDVNASFCFNAEGSSHSSSLNSSNAANSSDVANCDTVANDGNVAESDSRERSGQRCCSSGKRKHYHDSKRLHYQKYERCT